jgi:hypothetical protein
MRINRIFILILLLLSQLSITLTQIYAGESDENVLYVACYGVNLHKEPSSFSEILGTVDYGQMISVEGLEKPYLINSSNSKEEEKFVWAKTENKGKEGYIAVSCLVNKNLFERQDATKASLKAKNQAVSDASKGFSEAEEGDLTAMKGATGSARSGNANYYILDKIIELNSKNEIYTVNKEFRKTGKLGEYK